MMSAENRLRLNLMRIERFDGALIWEGWAHLHLHDETVLHGGTGQQAATATVVIDAPLELVPDFPFVRLPKEEDPDA